MAEKIFVDGLFYSLPNTKAPEWVIANLSINVKKLTEFLQKQEAERGWVNIDVKKSKSGSIYCEVSTYKPKSRGNSQPSPEAQNEAISDETPIVDIKDIPF